MIELMRFWFFSGFLLAGAAWSVDTLLRGKGVQLRGVWAAAMGLTILSPILPRLGSFGGGIDTREPLLAGVPSAEFDVLAQLATPLQTVLLDGVVLAAWAIISAALLAFGATVLFRLNQRARTWVAAKVRGEEVLVAPDFGPAVVGLARPAIVLPEELYRTRGSDLDLVLRHEREHVGARDPWLLLVGAAAVACMPWNLPLVWQATRLRAAVEEDCDIRVLRSGACRRSYADLLVRMASRSSGFGFAAAAMSERRSGLRRRLERLRNQEGQTRVAMTALLVIAGAGAIGVWTGMPSPVSWGGHGLHAPAATTPVVPLAPLAPLPPAAPVAPAPPGFSEAETLKRLYSKLSEEAERAGRDRLEASAAHQLALARLRAIDVDADDRASVAEVRRLQGEADRAARSVEAHEHLFDEISARLREAAARLNELTLLGNRSRSEVSSTGLKPIIYVNGEPFSGELADINPEDILRVEVAKGEPARRLHGFIATGDIVNIYLKTNGTGSN